RLATAAVGVLSLILSTWSLWWGTPDAVVEQKQEQPATAEQSEPNKLAENQIAGAKPLLAAQDQPADQQPGSVEDQVRLASGTEPSNPLGLGSSLSLAVAAERINPYAGDPVQGHAEYQEIQLPTDRIVQASTLEIHPGIRLAPPAGHRAK